MIYYEALLSQLGLHPKTSTRTTAGEGSTGLGLAIAHRIVVGHGGKIGISSKVGVGTTFRVELPIEVPE